MSNRPVKKLKKSRIERIIERQKNLDSLTRNKNKTKERKKYRNPLETFIFKENIWKSLK